MKSQLLLLALALSLCGCTTLKVRQSDVTPEGAKTETTVTGIAWFSSAQHFTKLKALQTAKTQSFGTDTFGQQGATNVTSALQSIAHILELLRPAP